jgi:hypothetical protein
MDVCHSILIASAGAYCARDMCICRRVHSPCQKSLRRASFGFEDLFGGDEGGDSSESMAADEVSAEGAPERSARLSGKELSLWIEFCAARADAQPLAARVHGH